MDSIIKTETFYRNTPNGVLMMDISTYDITYLDHPNCEYTYTQDVFYELIQHLSEYITQPKYNGKIMFHDIYFKNNKNENNPSRLELSLVWCNDMNTTKNISNYLTFRFYCGCEVEMIDFVKDLDMIIISREDGYIERCTI